MNVIFGYNDILKVGDNVRVQHSEHTSTISEVIKKPHCYIYKLSNPQWEFNWHFRSYLTLL